MRKLFCILPLLFVIAAQAVTREEVDAYVDSAYNAAMSGHIPEAICINEDGLALLPEDSAALRCEFYSCLLYCYHRLGDYEHALHYGELCLLYDEQQGTQEDLSASLGNLAGVYSSAGKHDVAIQYLQRAIDIENELLATDTAHSAKSLAIRKAMLGEVLVAKSKSQPEIEQVATLSEALQLTDEALQIERQLGRRAQEGVRLAQLANIYDGLGQEERARDYNRQALAIARETGNKPSELIILLQLGQLHEAVELAHELGMKKQEYEACDRLYKQAEEKGQYAEALKWLERVRVLHDQIQSEETQRQLTIAQVRYDSIRKEQQLADQQQELQRKQAREKALLFFSLLALLVIALLIVLVVLLRHRSALIAQQAADKKRQYGILSHDLRNPVMAQQQLLQMLYTDFPNYKPDEVHTLVGQLLAGSDNQLALLRNLQEMVQIDRQARIFRPAQLDLAALLRDTLPDVQSSALLKKITIELHAERILVETDRELVRTVLRNLLSNAIKFSPQGSSIDVGTIAPASFYVRDHGVGMSREQIRQIMNNRTQVKSSVGTDGESGTGYGLILCRELLNLCNCQMEIQSKPGEGTTFIINLQDAFYPVNKYENRYTR